MNKPPWIKALEIIGSTDLVLFGDGRKRRLCSRCGNLLKVCVGSEDCDGALARQALRAWRKARRLEVPIPGLPGRCLWFGEVEAEAARLLTRTP